MMWLQDLIATYARLRKAPQEANPPVARSKGLQGAEKVLGSFRNQVMGVSIRNQVGVSNLEKSTVVIDARSDVL